MGIFSCRLYGVAPLTSPTIEQLAREDMDRKKISAIATVVLALHAPSIMALETQEAQRFYERKAEGWFWYEVEPEPVEEPEPPVPEPLTELTPQKIEQPQTPSPTAPEPFSAAWVRENLPKYLDAAWNEPTM